MSLSAAFQTLTLAAAVPAVLVSHFLLTSLGYWNPEGRVTDTTVKLQLLLYLNTVGTAGLFFL